MAEAKKRWAVSVAIGLIALHGLMLLASAMKNSVTYDEFAHLPAGCAYWKYREFSMYNLSPPLLRMWAAAPVMLMRPVVPDPAPYRAYSPGSRHWGYGWMFGEANADRYQRLFFIGRLGMLPISMLGAWIIFTWSRKLYGDVGGIFSCAIYSLDPNLIAHGSIIGTDAGFAVATTLALRCWIGFCRDPKPRSALLAAAMIALAHVCKTSAMVLWPTLPVVFICIRRGKSREWRSLVAGIAVSALVTLLAINLSYGFWKPFQPLGRFEFESHFMQFVQSKLPYGTPVPFAKEFVIGFDAQKNEAEGHYATWLLGAERHIAPTIYYAIAFIAKTPLATLAIFLLLFRRGSRNREIRAEQLAIILAMLFVFDGMALLANINIGIRHLLAMYPLAFVLCGRVGARLRSARDALLPGILLVVLLIENLNSFPRYFTFFNITAGGTERGGWVVSDSNYDWGQSLLDLRDWMAEHHVDQIHLAYYGRVNPAWYGIHFIPMLDPADTEYVAISQMFLTGIDKRMAINDGTSVFVGLKQAEKLNQMKPVARVGSIFIFTRREFEASGATWFKTTPI